MGSYFRPTSLDDALAALASSARGGRTMTVLAGGTDHFPARVVQTPEEEILDITALPAAREIARRGDGWWIPCLATWTDVIEAALPPVFDGLKQAARQVGGVQIQNAGTLVGNLCNASPAADGIPCLLALDAAVQLDSIAGSRRVPLDAFLHGPRQTARRPEEIVTGIHVPYVDPNARSVFLKLGGRRYLVISIAMVAAVIAVDSAGLVQDARIAVGACSAKAQRLPALEQELIGHAPDAGCVRADHLAALAPIDDMRATAAYRRVVALELVRRAISL